MRTRILLTLIVATALVVPTAAIAKGGKKKSTYEFHGTLSAYTAAVGTTPGSLTLVVSKANKAGRPFVGLTLVFPVAPTTKVHPEGALIVDGDLGSVQLKGAPGLDATALQLLSPKEVVDETLGG